MTLNTITLVNGSAPVEKSLADWGIARCVREVNNQASDNLSFDLIARADEADPFPFGSQIILKIGRIPNAVNPVNPTLSPSAVSTPGLSYSGGKTFFIGWRIDNNRTASADSESLRYKFAGPWDFFLDRLVFQKLFLTWNGSQQICDWRSQIVLGMSLTDLTGPNDTIPGSIATARLSLSQQIREIVNYCINQTTAQYGSPQFQFDPLTMSGGLYPLNSSPGTFCKIPDYVPGLGTGLSGNGFAPGQTTQALQAPLEAVQDITCGEALRRQLRWIGGIGSPVAWFDYTQTPPALNISTRDQLTALSLPAFPNPVDPIRISGTKSLAITRRDDLVPSAVCLKFRVATAAGGITTVQVYDDIATPIGCTNESTGVTDSSLLPYRTEIAALVQTLDFEGPQSTSQPATINTVTLDLGDPHTDTTALACWQSLYPNFYSVTNLKLVTAATVTDLSNITFSTSGFGYLLLRGGAADWMITGSSPGAQAKVRISASFSYTSADDFIVANHPVTCDAIITNLPPAHIPAAHSPLLAKPSHGDSLPTSTASKKSPNTREPILYKKTKLPTRSPSATTSI